MLNEKSGINGNTVIRIIQQLTIVARTFGAISKRPLLKGGLIGTGSIIDRSDNPRDFTDFPFVKLFKICPLNLFA